MNAAAFITHRRRAWPVGRWSEMVCRAAWDEGPAMRTFLLEAADGARISFEPGQYMTFRIPTPGGFVERCYTISSSAERAGGIEITVKAQPGGAGSGALHAALSVGARIEAMGPAGRFSPARLPDGPYALIAAGSGVTPMLSILRTAADRGIPLDAVFVQVAASEAEAVAADEVPSLRRRLPGLRHHLVARPGRTARLDAARLMALIPDLADRMVFCCGPEGFMRMVEAAARSAGVPAERYAQESFAFDPPSAAGPIDTDAPARRITFARSGTAFDCPEGATILAAARAAGIALPASCALGQCGTCKTYKHSGAVDMVQDGGLRQREVDRGFVLPCVCRPLTDVILDR